MKKIVLVGVISAAFAAAPAFAQGYVGVGVGSSSASGVDRVATPLVMTGGNTSRTSVKVFGGFKFTPNWGIEAQYADLGSRNLIVTNGAAVAATGSIRMSQFSVAGTGTLPLASNFALFGKLGVSNNSGNGNSSNTAVLNVGSGSKSDLMIGVGVTYSITPKLAVRAEYEDFGIFNNSGANTIRANNFSVGLQYSF